MNIKNRKVIIVTAIFFSIGVLGILPTLAHAKPPDEWVCASSYEITIGSYYSGTISDTYTNDGQYLVGKCFVYFLINHYEILFDFSNNHYKQVIIDATTSSWGYYGNFYLFAYYTTGSPVLLGTFSPGNTKTYNLERSRVLDKIGLVYFHPWMPYQVIVYVDLINVLWTYIY